MLCNMVFIMKELDNILLLGTSNSTNYVGAECSLYHTITFKFFHTINEMGNIHKNRQCQSSSDCHQYLMYLLSDFCIA